MPYPEKRFFVVRHGETTDNAITKENPEGRVSGGSSNVELTEKGQQQAIDVVGVLEAMAAAGKIDLNATIIQRSELKRTGQTIAPLLQKYPAIPVEIFPSLNERSWGNIDGKETPKGAREIAKILGPQQAKAQHDIEPRDSFFERVNHGMHKLLSNIKSHTPLVVAHKGVLNAIVSDLYQIPVEKTKFEAKNATVYEFVPSHGLEGQVTWRVYEHKLERDTLKSTLLPSSQFQQSERVQSDLPPR